MKLAVVGNGRMGSAAAACGVERGHEIVVELGGAVLRGGAAGWVSAVRGADVALEFTHGEIAESNVTALLESGIPVISGTTGWTPSESLLRVVETSGLGFLSAPNFSVGVNLFFRAAAEAARLLAGSGLCQPYIVEHHHRGKRDAPSGTARRLAGVVRQAVPSLEIVEGESQGGLPEHTLHLASVRAGHEPGAHMLGFDGPDDIIRLEHHARGRGGFALGAVLAAEWLSGRSGLRGFDEVLDAWLDGTQASTRPAGGPGGR